MKKVDYFDVLVGIKYVTYKGKIYKVFLTNSDIKAHLQNIDNGSVIIVSLRDLAVSPEFEVLV